MTDFNKAEVTLDCPSCGHQFKQTLGRLKQDPTINCPGCGQAIKVDAQGLRDGLNSAKQAAADLARTIKKLNK